LRQNNATDIFKICQFKLLSFKTAQRYFNLGLNPCLISKFTFTFNQLANAFIQSELQMRKTKEVIKPTIGQKYANAVTSPS